MPGTPPVPPTARVAQIVFFGFTGLVWFRGLIAIVVLLLAGEKEPGYVLGFYGVGMFVSVFPAVAGFLATRPGGVRYAVALVAAFGMCFAGLSNLADNPLMGLLYGLMGLIAVVFVFLSTSFYVGRDRGTAAPNSAYAAPAAGGWPAPGSAPGGGWFPQQEPQQPYAQQQIPVQQDQRWQYPPQPAPGAQPPQQWQRPPQGAPSFRPPQEPPYGGNRGS